MVLCSQHIPSSRSTSAITRGFTRRNAGIAEASRSSPDAVSLDQVRRIIPLGGELRPAVGRFREQRFHADAEHPADDQQPARRDAVCTVLVFPNLLVTPTASPSAVCEAASEPMSPDVHADRTVEGIQRPTRHRRYTNLRRATPKPGLRRHPPGTSDEPAATETGGGGGENNAADLLSSRWRVPPVASLLPRATLESEGAMAKAVSAEPGLALALATW